MKSLTTLIRLQRQKVDELKRNVARLENEKARHERMLVQLAEELARELELSGKQPEMSGFFGDFADRIRRRRATTQGEIHKLDRLLDALAVQVHAAFAEQKKLEIANERRAEAARAEAARKETIALDDIASERHTRRNKESLT